MTAQPLESLPFAALLRQPAETAARVARAGALRLCRRGGDDLVLMSAGRAGSDSRLVDLSMRVLTATVRRDPGAIHDVLPTALPWMRFLPPDERRQFAFEFAAMVEAAATVGVTAPVAQLVIEWQHTAEIHADPELLRALSTGIDDDLLDEPWP